VRKGIRFLAFLLALAALFGGPGLVAPARAQTAAFHWEPESPLSGEDVTFTSDSTSLGNITSEEWDFNFNGTFRPDATGHRVTRSFGLPGDKIVALRVADDLGGPPDTAVRVVPVRNRPPTASFVHFPPSPFPGEAVSFVSTASDPDGPLVEQAWDLDGDGSFDDDAGPTAVTSFPAPAAYQVGLRVQDNQGEAAAQSRMVNVVAATPAALAQRATSTPLLNPFPIVRITGGFTRRGTRLRRLVIDAPSGAAVVVRCRGRRCPARRRSYTAADRPAARMPRARSARLIRARRFERRLLRPGTVLKVFVTKPQTIGKYARFRIRRSRPPARLDLCLLPGVPDPVACPPR
jgi:hypothetical protein